MNRHQAADDVLADIDSVLGETLDGAHDDWSVSPDAMRWSPEPLDPPRLAPFEPPRFVVENLAQMMHLDMALIRAAFQQVMDAFRQTTVQIDFVLSTTDLCLLGRPDLCRRCARQREMSAMHAAYVRRSRARRKRRR